MTIANPTRQYTFANDTPAVGTEVETEIANLLSKLVQIVSAINDAAGSMSSLDSRLSVMLNSDGTLKGNLDWIPEPNAVTYVDTTTFYVAGDRTDIYRIGRGIKATIDSGDVTGEISANSTYDATYNRTAVTITDAVIDGTLSSIQYGIYSSIIVQAASDSQQAAIDAADASRLSVGEVTTGVAGTDAFVAITGESGNQVIDFTIPRGDKGDVGPQGVSVSSFALVSGDHSPGTTDTYRITLSNNLTYDFTVYNGADGAGGTGGSGFNYVQTTDPTVSVNPTSTPVTWLNSTTGAMWVCFDNTPNANIWRSNLGRVIGTRISLGADPFGDGSCESFYPLNGDANDYSGNDRHGTPTDVTYTDGLFGLAAEFNGVSSIIDIDTWSDLTVSYNKNFTISLWVKFLNAAKNMPVLSFGGTTQGLGLGVTDGNNIGAGACQNSVYTFMGSGSAVYSVGTWRHMVLTHSDSGESFFWLDNSPVNYHENFYDISDGNGADRIGAADIGSPLTKHQSPEWSKSLLCHIRFFNKVVSADEVEKLYLEGK